MTTPNKGFPQFERGDEWDYNETFEDLDDYLKGIIEDKVEKEIAEFGNVLVGENTELQESGGGETILTNTAGHPINIQTYPSGRAFLQSNDTNTTIETQDEWVGVEGMWNSAHLNAISANNGKLTYDGAITSQVMYFIGGSAETFNNNETFEIAVFLNDQIKENTRAEVDFARGDELISLPAIIGFTDTTNTGDTHEVKIRNRTSTTDIRVQSLSFALKG